MSDTVPPSSEIARVLPGYRIEAEIGRGGMGVVYLAEDLGPLHRKKVALKVLAPFLGSNEKFRQRFTTEAQVVANLVHPCIVPVYEFGEAGGLLYLVMHYVEGPDLGLLIEQQGQLQPGRVAKLVGQVAGALDSAHRQGLIHRDVKPANVLIARPGSDDEHAYLGDFGITKNTSSGESLTATGQFVGTVDYIAPEQIECQPIDGRADVYALGGVLYHCLTGHVAYPRENEMAKLWAHLRDPPPSLRALRPDLSDQIEQVVHRAMAKDPDDRYPSCGELAADLRAVVARPTVERPAGVPLGKSGTGPVPSAPPGGGFGPESQTAPAQPPLSPPTEPPPAPSRRRAGVAIVIAAVAIAAGGVLAFVLLSGGDEFPNQDEEAVLRRIPAGFRDSCQRAEGSQPDDALAAVDCIPDEGADAATFVLFEDRSGMRALYERELTDSPVDKDAGGDCIEDLSAEHEYTDNRGDSGRVFCYRRGDDESVIVWTNPEFKSVGKGFRPDDEDANLYAWWAELVDRRTDDDFPLAAERALLDLVPASFVDTCTRSEALEDTEIASVGCTPASGADDVFYTRFDSNEAMFARYQAILEQVGVAPDSGETACPSEATYTLVSTGATGGRVLCYLEGTDARVTWTNVRDSLLTEVIRLDGDAAAALEFWRSSGA